jgi:WD40 repeat protein
MRARAARRAPRRCACGDAAAPCTGRGPRATLPPRPLPRPYQVRGVCVCDLGVLTSSRDKTVKLWVEDGGCFTLMHTLVRAFGGPAGRGAGEGDAAAAGRVRGGAAAAAGPRAARGQAPGVARRRGAPLHAGLGAALARRPPRLHAHASSIPLSNQVGHTNYVGPVTYIPPGTTPDLPNGAIVSGARRPRRWRRAAAAGAQRAGGPGQRRQQMLHSPRLTPSAPPTPTPPPRPGSFDTTVRVWDPVSATELAVLRGHQYQVTALGVLPSGDIVSASVDKCAPGAGALGLGGSWGRRWERMGRGWMQQAAWAGREAAGSQAPRRSCALRAPRTIRVWRGTECIATLEGHEGPVLSLAVTPEGDILSGSGDTTVRRWSSGKCVQTYKGHTDTVRCVARRRAAGRGAGWLPRDCDCAASGLLLAGSPRLQPCF